MFATSNQSLLKYLSLSYFIETYFPFFDIILKINNIYNFFKYLYINKYKLY